ncbi:MAG: hypothetical protein Q9202_006199 [Teloschistes flavicans]
MDGLKLQTSKYWSGEFCLRPELPRPDTSSENRFIIDAILELKTEEAEHTPNRLLWLDSTSTSSGLLRPLSGFCARACNGEASSDSGLQSPAEDEKNPNGLFYRLLGVKDPATGEPISYSELLAEAQLLQVAGT